jgi:hypothetical protein
MHNQCITIISILLYQKTLTDLKKFFIYDTAKSYTYLVTEFRKYYHSINITLSGEGRRMVGRYRNPKGIKYTKWIPYQPNEIRYNDILDFDEEEITILAHRPGIGKTYNILKFLKEKSKKDDDFKFFYFTDRHNAIKEHTKDWKEGTFSHWKGFNKICINPRMKVLNEYHLNPIDICKSCGKCGGYVNQFDENKRVFAPFNFLNNKHYKNNLPDIIILDENIKQYTTYSDESKKAKRLFKEMGRDDLLELIEDKDKHSKLERKLSHDKLYEEYKEFILKLTKEKGKNKVILGFIKGFNIFSYHQYLKWNNIYGYDLPAYSFPLLYYGAFETVTKGTPAVFLDATFNKHWFSYLLESYNAETKFMGNNNFTNLMVFFFYTENKDYEIKSTIYRMRPNDMLSKSGFIDKQKWKHTVEWLSSDMKLIMNIFGKNNVGIITYKDLGEFPKALGYNIEYYGNLRGLNILENKPVLVIIGSYIPILCTWHPNFKRDSQNKEGFDEIFSRYFLLHVNKNNLHSVGVQAPDFVARQYKYKIAKTYGYQYKDSKVKLLDTWGDEIVKHPAEALISLFWYDEIYQAFHRNRGLRHPRLIFSYCWFPEPEAIIYATDQNGKITEDAIDKLSLFSHNLRDEFDVDKIYKDRFNELFEYLSETEYGKGGLIEDIINDILQNPNITSKELTAKYKVQKTGEKRGADTIPMTKLIEGIRALLNQVKRVE